MYKHTVVKACYVSQVIGITEV